MLSNLTFYRPKKDCMVLGLIKINQYFILIMNLNIHTLVINQRRKSWICGVGMEIMFQFNREPVYASN